MYEVDRDQMTLNNLHFCFNRLCTIDPQIIGEFQPNGDSWSTPAYWNGSIYYCGSNGELSVYPLSGGVVSSVASSFVPFLILYPGATPAISANGTTNGIVWAVDSSNWGSFGPPSAPAILHYVLDARRERGFSELYNTTQAQNRDVMGNAVKFVVPTVANGKVYVGTQTEVDVYGFAAGTEEPPTCLRNSPATLKTAHQAASLVPGQVVSLSSARRRDCHRSEQFLSSPT